MSDPIFWQNYRIKVYPTEEQKKRIFFMMDSFRFVYNWGLSYYNDHYKKTGKTIRRYDLTHAMEDYRRQSDWLSKCELTSCRFALFNVLDAFKRFYKTKNGAEYPKFKKKSRAKRTVQLRGERVKFYENGQYVHLPGITTSRKDLTLCKNHQIPSSSNTSYRNVYLTYDGNSFWLSLSIALKVPFDTSDIIRQGKPLGIDVGVRTSAYLSNGISYDPPNQHRVDILNNRIEKLQSAVMRDNDRRCRESMRMKTKYVNIPKSKNQLKRERKYRQAHRDLVNLYQSHYHKISRDIINQSPEFVVMETLGIRELQRKTRKRISKEIHDARIGTLIKYIDYKCKENSIDVVYADRNFPSTKKCSNCGTMNNIGGEKTYRCKCCGLVIDRDYNASLNLLDFGLRSRNRLCHKV